MAWCGFGLLRMRKCSPTSNAPAFASFMESDAMRNEPMPKWRTAQKQHQCQGDGCAKVIAPGDRYLDQALTHPTNSHLRYCQECAEPVIQRANGYHFFNG